MGHHAKGGDGEVDGDGDEHEDQGDPVQHRRGDKHAMDLLIISVDRLLQHDARDLTGVLFDRVGEMMVKLGRWRARVFDRPQLSVLQAETRKRLGAHAR